MAYQGAEEATKECHELLTEFSDFIDDRSKFEMLSDAVQEVHDTWYFLRALNRLSKDERCARRAKEIAPEISLIVDGSLPQTLGFIKGLVDDMKQHHGVDVDGEFGETLSMQSWPKDHAVYEEALDDLFRYLELQGGYGITKIFELYKKVLRQMRIFIKDEPDADLSIIKKHCSDIHRLLQIQMQYVSGPPSPPLSPPDIGKDVTTPPPRAPFPGENAIRKPSDPHYVYIPVVDPSSKAKAPAVHQQPSVDESDLETPSTSSTDDTEDRFSYEQHHGKAAISSPNIPQASVYDKGGQPRPETAAPGDKPRGRPYGPPDRPPRGSPRGGARISHARAMLDYFDGTRSKDDRVKRTAMEEKDEKRYERSQAPTHQRAPLKGESIEHPTRKGNHIPQASVESYDEDDETDDDEGNDSIDDADNDDDDEPKDKYARQGGDEKRKPERKEGETNLKTMVEQLERDRLKADEEQRKRDEGDKNMRDSLRQARTERLKTDMITERQPSPYGPLNLQPQKLEEPIQEEPRGRNRRRFEEMTSRDQSRDSRSRASSNPRPILRSPNNFNGPQRRRSSSTVHFEDEIEGPSRRDRSSSRHGRLHRRRDDVDSSTGRQWSRSNVRWADEEANRPPKPVASGSHWTARIWDQLNLVTHGFKRLAGDWSVVNLKHTPGAVSHLKNQGYRKMTEFDFQNNPRSVLNVSIWLCEKNLKPRMLGITPDKHPREKHALIYSMDVKHVRDGARLHLRWYGDTKALRDLDARREYKHGRDMFVLVFGTVEELIVFQYTCFKLKHDYFAYYLLDKDMAPYEGRPLESFKPNRGEVEVFRDRAELLTINGHVFKESDLMLHLIQDEWTEVYWLVVTTVRFNVRSPLWIAFIHYHGARETGFALYESTIVEFNAYIQCTFFEAPYKENNGIPGVKFQSSIIRDQFCRNVTMLSCQRQRWRPTRQPFFS